MKQFFIIIYLHITNIVFFLLGFHSKLPRVKSKQKEIFASCDITASETCCFTKQSACKGNDIVKCDYKWDVLMRCPGNLNRSWDEVFVGWADRLCKDITTMSLTSSDLGLD